MCLFTGQAHPIDFSGVDIRDLSTDVVAGIDNFEESELDQYLPPNSHHHGVRGGPGVGQQPPPPYVPNQPVSNTSAPTSTWATPYRMSTPSASNQLQRMASTSSSHSTGNSSPISPGNTSSNTNNNTNNNTSNTSHDLHPLHNSNMADSPYGPHSSGHGHSQQSPTTSSDDTSATSSYPGEHHSPPVKMEHSHGLQIPDFRSQLEQNRFSYELHQPRFYALSPQEGQDMDVYGPGSDQAAAQYYAQSSAMYSPAPPPYQCMTAGLRSIYPTGTSGTVPPINANSQWDRYGRP